MDSGPLTECDQTEVVRDVGCCGGRGICTTSRAFVAQEPGDVNKDLPNTAAGALNETGGSLAFCA